jgi:aminopeptidase N
MFVFASIRLALGLPALLLALAATAPVRADEPTAGVRHYEVQLAPDIAARSVVGHVALTLATDRQGPLQLDAGEGLSIDSISERGQPLRFNRGGGVLTVDLPPASAGVGERVVDVRYHGMPASGMRFLPALQQVYTAFSTRQWLPCIDSPAHRATLTLTLDLPAGLLAVANGRLQRSERRPDGGSRSVWVQAEPVPSYLFGFAAGPFREVVDDSAAPTLRFLGPASFSDEQLRQVFRDTRPMIDFYAGKAGVPFPAASYTQVLVSEPAAQEAAGFALLSEGYGRRVLADPTANWLAAHELSHQWWGNAVTNRDWNEFWLNEGIASFMNAAWFEHRLGPAGYQRHIGAAREKYEQLRAAGADKPLVFPDWRAPTAMDRSLVYDKGAWVVHLLRETMGEAAFWRGLKGYTQRFWGRPVTSRDFQAAMQAASERDLGPFFERWVSGARP